ncbi:MAG: hypothetical protein LBU05_01070 [Bifidobacteriaceae bacterium]|nr:hypothetical protein [Bifidobacteriaceae bacterium]
MSDGSGWFAKLTRLVVGLIVIGMVLSALQAALCQVMPTVVAVGLVVGAVWLVWRIVQARRNRW